MTRRAAVRQAEISRIIRAAQKAGMAPGSFTVEVDGGRVRLLPAANDGALTAAQEAEKRMREAFGE
jgi:hypothetical protein